VNSKLTRKQQAEKIISCLDKYKVCHGCESITSKETSVCPLCKSYNFNLDVEAVRKQAIVLSNKTQTIITDYE